VVPLRQHFSFGNSNENCVCPIRAYCFLSLPLPSNFLFFPYLSIYMYVYKCMMDGIGAAAAAGISSIKKKDNTH